MSKRRCLPLCAASHDHEPLSGGVNSAALVWLPNTATCLRCPSPRSFALAIHARFVFSPSLDGRFKLIPREVHFLPELKFTDVEWESLALPINLAFFFQSSPGNQMKAMYPSPAGATESLLPLKAWDSLGSKQYHSRADGTGRRGAPGQSGRQQTRILPRTD